MLSEDFEYSIDKYLVPKIRLRCPLHSKEPAQYVCTEPSCRRPSILCRSCQVDSAEHCQQHKSYFKSIDTYLIDVTAEMESAAPTNKSILTEIYAQNPSLQKWQDDDEQHLRKLEAHISAQKAIIDDDMATLSTLLISSFDEIRENIHAKLDAFFKKYCDTFNQQKTSLNENFGLAKQFSLFINPSNLASKLQSDMPAQAAQFVGRLNKSLDSAKIMAANKANFVNSFKAINAQLTNMTDNLPYYNPSDQIQQQIKPVAKLIEQFFDRNVIMLGSTSADDASPLSAGPLPFGSLNPQPSQQQQYQQLSSHSPINNFQGNLNNNFGAAVSTQNLARQQSQQQQYVAPSPAIGIPGNSSSNTSSNNINSANNLNNNLQNKKQFKISKTGKQMQLKNTDQNISIKPVKKFQLEIPICSVAALSETHFALASVNDGKLKIFESQSKKMQIFSAHVSAITFVTRLKVVFDASDSINPAPRIEDLSNKHTESSKKMIIATASADQTVLLTKYDVDKQSLPQQYIKLTGFIAAPQFIMDVQDGIHLLTGDSFGEVQIWNYHEGRILHTIKNKHSGKIVGIYLIKQHKRFIIVSDEAISMWKYQTTSTAASSRIDRVFQECIIPTEGTQIGRIVSFLSAYRENLCFIGNTDGEIVIYDLNQRKVLHKWNAHGRVPVIDLCLFELEDKRDVGTLISIGLSDKSIKTWKINASGSGSGDYERGGSVYQVGEATLLDGNSLNDDIYAKNKMQIVQSSCPKLVIANERDKEFLLYNLFL